MQSKILSQLKLPLQSLVPFQGEFKTLGKKQFEKLKKSIEQNGFIQPFFVWKSKDQYFILDGHQRFKAIMDLYGKETLVDCIEIAAPSVLDAKKLVIYYSSSYAQFDKDSFFDFAEGLRFDELEAFEFPNFSISESEFTLPTNKELDSSSFSQFDHQCPKCGFEWNK